MRRCFTIGIALLLAILSALPAGKQAAAADAPEKVVHLFNGKNLDGFYTWLKGHGKNKDPDSVFTVKDGVIRVSGQAWGGFITEKEYENYHLIAEFTWGEKTWAPREKATR